MVQKPEKTLTAKAVGREFVRQVNNIMNSNDFYIEFSYKNMIYLLMLRKFG